MYSAEFWIKLCENVGSWVLIDLQLFFENSESY